MLDGVDAVEQLAQVCVQTDWPSPRSAAGTRAGSTRPHVAQVVGVGAGLAVVADGGHGRGHEQIWVSR